MIIILYCCCRNASEGVSRPAARRADNDLRGVFCVFVRQMIIIFGGGGRIRDFVFGGEIVFFFLSALSPPPPSRWKWQRRRVDRSGRRRGSPPPTGYPPTPFQASNMATTVSGATDRPIRFVGRRASSRRLSSVVVAVRRRRRRSHYCYYFFFISRKKRTLINDDAWTPRNGRKCPSVRIRPRNDVIVGNSYFSSISTLYE